MSLVTRLDPFQFDVESVRADYDRTRWVHVRGGASGELMATITDQAAALIGSSQADLENWRYPEKKEQYLWELPEGLDVSELCRVVALSTGMDPERTVLSERHLKVYSATAPEMPPPHKDRSASTVTVGVGVDIPADSRLVLWPEVDQTYNPYPTAAEWRDTRSPDELPELVVEGVDPIEVDLRRGDVVMFAGAEYYHERYRPARTTVLYLKFNDLGLDPLGEDPRTVAAERRSVELERDGVTVDSVVAINPRVIGIRRDELFPALATVASVRVFGDAEGTQISADEAELLSELSRHGARRVGDVVDSPEAMSRLIRLGLVLLA